MSAVLFGRALPSDLVEVIRGPFPELEKSADEKAASQSPTSGSSSAAAQKKLSTSWFHCYKTFFCRQ
jgi:hypothetical protein